MGTFTIATGLGLLFCGIITMGVIGFLGLHIINKMKDEEQVGPYSEEKQFQRAKSIQRLLDENPKLDPLYRAMWKKHLLNLALNETTYNYRVKNIYENMKPQNRGWINYE